MRPSAWLPPFLLAASGAAQIGGDGRDGHLRPTQDTTVARGGLLQYQSVLVPQGVTVRFTGSQPVEMRCQGDVIIAGRLTVSAEAPAFTTAGKPGPGGYAGVSGCGLGGLEIQACLQPGSGPGAGRKPTWTFDYRTTAIDAWKADANPGRHRGAYGSDYPFSFTGGSGASSGGWAWFYFATNIWVVNVLSGGSGGGALAILCDGKLEISGTVDALGGELPNTIVEPGASGSILLRSTSRVVVDGAVDAGGPQPGWVRIDAFDSDPTIRGRVNPTPVVLRLPELRVTLPPLVGGYLGLASASLPGDVALVFASGKTASIPLPPVGTLFLDPASGITMLTAIAIPSVGLDPIGVTAVQIPNDARLKGLPLHLQGVRLPVGPFGARFTNLASTVIGP